MSESENSTDMLWLEQLKNGNEAAYQRLFELYYFPLASFATKYIGDQTNAEDVVQDILYELLCKPQKFMTIVSLKSYLYAAVQNKCLDTIRHTKVKQRYAHEMLANEEEFFYENILEEEVYQILKQAIRQLPSKTQEVYELILQGHDNKEIGEILCLTMDAVKSQRKRGKKILEETLQHLKGIYIISAFLFLQD